MKVHGWFFIGVSIVLGLSNAHLSFALARFAPGETLNPNCAPTDPDCRVSAIRTSHSFTVPDIAARDALPDVQVGDHVEVTSVRQSFLFAQDRSWKELSKTEGEVFIVPDLTALNDLTNVQVGDHAEVTSLKKSYVRAPTGAWQELLTPYSNTYVVTDLDELNALTNVQVGDHAEVTNISQSYIRTQDNVWQKILTPHVMDLENIYVVTDISARDALTDLQSGDMVVVTGSNITYVRTRDNTWQELLAPSSDLVQSVNGKIGSVVLNADDILEGASNKYFSQSQIRSNVSASSPLSYEVLTGTFGLSFLPPLVLNGGQLALDQSQIGSLLGLDEQNALQLNPFGDASGNTSEIRFLELGMNGSQYVGFKAPDAITTDQVWTLPNTDGFAGQVLSTNGLGGLTWITPTAGGTSTAYTAGSGLSLVGTEFLLTSPVSIEHGGTGTTTIEGALASLVPDQTGNAGKVLTTNGRSVSWQNLSTNGGVTWGSITGTLADQTDLSSVLAEKEPSITTGTTSQYWRGDKTFQPLNKAAVGLTDVENMALSLWPGTSNLTTLGIVASGTWRADQIEIAKGGTGATTAAAARTNLGLDIGVNIQEFDADLARLAAQSGIHTFPVRTGVGTITETAYLEGTFTPTVTLVGGSGNIVPVYTTNIGRYTRIGRLCWVNIFLEGDGGAEGAGSGIINIALPFTASANQPSGHMNVVVRTNGTLTPTVASIAANATTIELIASPGSSQNNTTRSLRLSFFYEI